jgi:hypothetical protein
MSLTNGDKSRAHRERKQNIERRKRTRALLDAQAAKTSTPVKRTKKEAGGSSEISR